MNRSAVTVSCALLLLASTAVYPSERARITIIPLNYIGVSKADASAMTRLLETAVVKTDSFTVIEQTQVGEILSAQEYSLQECTDEKCAVRLGKLLAAEQIILGDVSRVGTKIIMTAKIIDVETGKTLKADKVEATTLEGLADEAELLAFKLAGLTYQKGSQEVIAKTYGELFVQTSPEDAEVIVNGISRGRSPVLVSKVPLGKVMIECRREALYASREIDLTGEGLREVSLSLTVRLGNLFVRSSEKAVNVWLDGKDLGPLGSGLFKDVAVGDHRLELRGAGLYWKGELRITDTGTATVDAVPAAVGDLEYSLPEGTRAEITGNGIRLVVSGTGRTYNLAVGAYNVQVSGETYQTFTGTVQVTMGRRTRFEPVIQRTEQYQAAIVAQERERSLQRARVTVSSLEAIASTEPLFDLDAQLARMELGFMEASPYRFEDEERRARDLVALIERKAELRELTEQRDELVNRSKQARAKLRGGRIGGWLTLGTGVLALGGGIASYLLGSDAMAVYDAATTTAAADAARIQVENYSLSFTICSISAGSLLVLSPLIFKSGGSLDPAVEAELRDLNRRIDALSR